MNNQLEKFGDWQEISDLAKRLQITIPGASKLTEVEALTVAQVAVAHNLDPFNGEVFLLKSEKDGVIKYAGVMIGIKGLRKLASRQLGNGDSYWISFFVDTPDKVLGSQDGRIGKAVCWRCELRDTKSIRRWTERMASLQNDLKLPYEVVKELMGSLPITVGFGVAYTDEFSKMNLHDRARKRAEAQAIRQRFDIEFSYGEPDENYLPEFVEGVEKPGQLVREQAQIIEELGYPADDHVLDDQKQLPQLSPEHEIEPLADKLPALTKSGYWEMLEINPALRERWVAGYNHRRKIGQAHIDALNETDKKLKEYLQNHPENGDDPYRE